MENNQRKIYCIYVIELSKKVFTLDRKFREANPQYNGVLECVYVGMTSKTPRERFLQHKNGTLSKKGHNLAASIVYKYGKLLRGSLTEHLGLMTKSEALKMERQFALELRRRGYAVWFN